MRVSYPRVIVPLLCLAITVMLFNLLSALLYFDEKEEVLGKRHLESLPPQKLVNSMVFIDKEVPSGFVDIPREKPKVSFSTLDELLKEERKLHNSVKENVQEVPEEMKKLVGEGIPVSRKGGAVNLSSLKASLKDTGFKQKIKDLEDKRQELYLQILTKRGQLIDDEKGGKIIVSYPQAPVKFPNNLKKDLTDWTFKEHVWLNISHFPWPLDPECRKYSVTFAKPKALPIVGLASYPSSGNTWLRYLLEGITGYYTGSMYNDIMLRKKGFYGEGVSSKDGLVVTVKTHGHTTEKGSHVPRPQQVKYNHHKEVNHSAILIIRNPYSAIIGHRNLDTGGHTGLAKLDQFLGPGWQEFVEIKAEAWLNFYSDWLENNPSENLLVLHYENIQQNLKHTLRKIVAFLGFEEDKSRIDCTVKFQTGQFKRKHNGDFRDNPFTETQRDIIARSIVKLNDILKRYRKETLPLEKYEHFNLTNAYLRNL